MQTLLYFETEKKPLCLSEIDFYLIAPNKTDTSFSTLKEILAGLVAKKIIREKKGLYFLNKKKQFSWLNYLERTREAQKKIEMVKRKLYLIKKIPFIRAIYLCGSVAGRNCSRKSDIDFLILTETNRTWTVRFFMTLASWWLGKKTRDGRSRKNKFCLNHYRGLSDLELERELKDLYSAKEYAQMIALYTFQNNSNKDVFLKKNRLWLKKFLPNHSFQKPAVVFNHLHSQNIFPIFIERLLAGRLGGYLENLLKNLQQMKIKKNLKLDRSRIILENNIIMFHLNPKAPLVLKKFQLLKNKLSYFKHG